MIRACRPADVNTMLAIINESAQAYRGVIPADRWHEPYMTLADLQREIDDGVHFFGCHKMVTPFSM